MRRRAATGSSRGTVWTSVPQSSPSLGTVSNAGSGGAGCEGHNPRPPKRAPAGVGDATGVLHQGLERVQREALCSIGQGAFRVGLMEEILVDLDFPFILLDIVRTPRPTK